MNLDGRRRTLHSDCWRLWLVQSSTEGLPNHLRVDPEASLDWSQLDRLPLRELTYSGRDPGVIGYVASREGLRDLGWLDHHQRSIDLRSTELEALILEPGPRPLRLALPTSLRRLGLHPIPAGGGLVVDASAGGAELELNLDGSDGPPEVVKGLEQVRRLSLIQARRVEVARLAAFRSLEELSVFGVLARIPDAWSLACFERLRRLRLIACYDFGEPGLPGPDRLPSLETLEIDGLRRADAAAIEQRFSGSGVKLSIRGARGEAWLRANADNPFRDWDRYHPARVASKAKAAWRKAVTAVGRLEGPGTRAEVEPLLRALVESFNRLDARDPLDTIACEEISDALFELALSTEAVDEATAQEWFDLWRRF